MLRDVFYYSKKPNVHPRERFATSIEDARSQCTTEHFWIINEYCDYRNFDWDWDFEFLQDEDVWAEEHNNVWPSQHQKDSGTWLCPKQHSEIIIYRADVDVVKRKNEKNDNWVLLDLVDETKFDFSWHPDPTEPPFVYTWGCKYFPVELKASLEYHAPNSVNIKYINHLVELVPEWDKWKNIEYIDKGSFDFSWRPDPREPAFIYQFGTQWQKTNGPTYVVDGASQIKYLNRPKAKTLFKGNNWIIPSDTDTTDFDFTWHPDDTEPPYVYQFGTLIDKEDGPRYVHPDAIGDTIVYLERMDTARPKFIPKYIIETTLDDLVKQHPTEIFWALHENIDYVNFNFDWRPEIVNIQWENEFVSVFGSPESVMTQTYFVNANMYLKGYNSFKFIENEALTEQYLSNLFKKSSMFFVDKGNDEATFRFEQLKERFPNIQKTRYLNSWVDTINRCVTRSITELCWILNSELDYSEFDFEYYPNPWQMKMIHVFGTQWSHWGTTYMVNREIFAEDTKYIKVIEHLSNLNFVKQRRAKATTIVYDIVYIDHGNKDLSNIDNLVVKYEKSYLNTFRKMLTFLPVKKEHYIWVASSICDYTDFDFTYICDPFAKEQLHVFPSDKQKFGDTFLIDVNKLRTLISDIKTLEDYNKINFNQHQRVKRLSAPVIITEGDSHVSSINTEFNFPYAVFVTNDNKNLNVIDTEPMSVWSEETKNITITSKGGTRIIVPKEAKQYVKKELYDYPYIITSNKLTESNPLDIIFFSNGETSADKNYEHLLKITQGLSNKITRIDGINGRVKSQHVAASNSNTPWYFLVNAKLKVTSKFDFNWQPDRLQIPKHYIFHATNPVNGLVYGHQAIVANNKRLTLANSGVGLDFTMDSEHEVIPINSGIGMYNSSEWDTWRTAFRECIKLKASGTTENNIRLNTWLTVGLGDFSNYSLQGAQHAVEYFNEVKGDFDKLRLSYDWAWLRNYYETKYKL
jgi:hypothetical protein